MPRILITMPMPAPAPRVWELLADLGTHDEWMRDAESVEITTPQTRGLGVRMDVATKIGPFRTLDVMEVTGWDEGRSIEVRHEGVVSGTGTLSVEPDGPDRSVVTWIEDLEFPWYLGGPITAWFARPVLAWVWRANLRGLARLVSSP